MNISQAIAEVSSLPPLDRLRIAEAIWDSLDDTAIPPPTEAQLQVLERRLAAHDADPLSAVSADEIERRAAERRKHN
jgi:putative addiction module component (TIGR02574 family)